MVISGEKYENGEINNRRQTKMKNENEECEIMIGEASMNNGDKQ
jgi:hypothetical protein